MTNKNEKRIQLLDCTLRDGGFAFEDAEKNGNESQFYTPEEIDSIIKSLSESNLDIVEIGAIERSVNDKKRFAIYQSVEDISNTILKSEQAPMYAAFLRGPDIPLEDIPDCNDNYCNVLRLCVRYSEIQKSLDYCEGLALKGYKVFIQPMVTMRYTEEQIQQLIACANKINAYALYFVDSYGYMQAEQVQRMFQRFDKDLKDSVRIGFHAHNNMNLAYSNAISLISLPTKRKLVLDSCALGLGQGAGNLQTEIIVNHMNRFFQEKYQFDSVLEVCEVIEKHHANSIWGYSVTRFLPAIHETAYKYACALRDLYGLSFVQINHVLSHVPEELRHRYTIDNTEKLLKLNHIEFNKME